MHDQGRDLARLHAHTVLPLASVVVSSLCHALRDAYQRRVRQNMPALALVLCAHRSCPMFMLRVGQPGAQFQGMVQRDPAIPLIIGAASPRALSLGSQASLCTPEPSQAAPPLQRPSDSPASAGSLTLPGSAAATNTPMDMIMLQGLGSLPLDGLACSSSESLMSDAMGLFDPLLPVAAL